MSSTQSSTARSLKDVVEELEGPEQPTLIFDFDAPKDDGKFYESADPSGTYPYNRDDF